MDGASRGTEEPQRDRSAPRPSREPGESDSPFDGITRDGRVKQIRRLHAEILELERGTGERPDTHTRARIRTRKEVLADRLASLGYSRYAEFAAKEGSAEVKLIDVRDARESPTLDLENDARASAPDRVARTEPPQPAAVVEVNGKRSTERPKSRRAVRADEDQRRRKPWRKRKRVPTEGDVELRGNGAVASRSEVNAVAADASPRQAAIAGRDDPASPRAVPVDIRHGNIEPALPYQQVARAVRDDGDVDDLRWQLAAILQDVATGIRSATGELRDLAGLARAERQAIEARHRAAEQDARAVIEAARAQAIVVRLEAAVAARAGIEAPIDISGEAEARQLGDGSTAHAPEASASDDNHEASTAGTSVAVAGVTRDHSIAQNVPVERPAPPGHESSVSIERDKATARPTQRVVSTRAATIRRSRRRRRVAIAAVSTAAISVGAVAAVSHAMAGRDEPTLAPRSAPAVAGRLLPGDASVPRKAAAPTTATPTTARPTPTSAKSGAAGAVLPKRAATAATAAPTDPAVESAYVAGYKAECQALWSHAGPDGLLWDPDDRESGGHKIDECLSSVDSTNAASYDNTKDATDGGRSDADTWVNGIVTGTQLEPTNGPPFDISQ